MTVENIYEWPEETMRQKLEALVETYLPDLVGRAPVTDSAALRSAYYRAFERLLQQLGDDESEAAMNAIIRQAVERAVSTGPQDPSQVIRDDRILSEIGSLSGWIFGLALQRLRGEIKVTPEIRQKAEEVQHRLVELGKKIRAECPYLMDPKQPQPPIPLAHPGHAQQQISESIVDCGWVRKDGRDHPMSFRIAHQRPRS